MLIKIRTTNSLDHWEIFENCTNVQYTMQPVKCKNYKEYREAALYLGLCLHNNDYNTGLIYGTVMPYPHYGMPGDPATASTDEMMLPEPDSSDGWRYFWLKFTRDGRNYSVIFEAFAYVCNDEGKTIQKVGDNFGYPLHENGYNRGSVPSLVGGTSVR